MACASMCPQPSGLPGSFWHGCASLEWAYLANVSPCISSKTRVILAW